MVHLVGAKKFFAPDAIIDPMVGSRYHIIFDPESDPEGRYEGTYGAKILRYKKDRELAFEWTMPPFVAELSTKPLLTWIEIHFETVAGQTDRTHVAISHYGFGSGEKWYQAYE